MAASKKLIAIVIPAYNEASVIGAVIDSLPDRIDNLKTIIIIVNDGSSDGTAEVVKKHNKVILINHLLNSGAGAATRTGLNYAKKIGCDFAATMDADGQHLAEDVEKIIHFILNNQTDLVIGSRLVETKGMPWYRVVGNKGLSFITYLVFGVFVKDSQSGLRAYNRRAMQDITFYSNNYAFCSEIIWVAHRKKLRIKEVPIKAVYSDYSLAKGQSNWGAVAIIRQILKRRLLHIFNG